MASNTGTIPQAGHRLGISVLRNLAPTRSMVVDCLLGRVEFTVHVFFADLSILVKHGIAPLRRHGVDKLGSFCRG